MKKIKVAIHIDRFPSGDDLDDYKIVIIRTGTNTQPLRVLETSHEITEDFKSIEECLDYINALQLVVTDKQLLCLEDVAENDNQAFIVDNDLRGQVHDALEHPRFNDVLGVKLCNHHKFLRSIELSNTQYRFDTVYITLDLFF